MDRGRGDLGKRAFSEPCIAVVSGKRSFTTVVVPIGRDRTSKEREGSLDSFFQGNTGNRIKHKHALGGAGTLP